MKYQFQILMLFCVTVFTVKNSVRNIQTKTEIIQRKTIQNNDCNHHYFAVGRLD